MIINEDDYLAHYGILRRSGRYPWGSGGPESNDGPGSFLGYLAKLRKEGLSDTEIAKVLEISTTDLRNARSIARNAQKQSDIALAQRLREKGMSNVAIGKRMGKPEPTVRALLAPGQKDKTEVLTMTSGALKEKVTQKGFIDVGSGVERHIGISRTKLDNALALLKDEGYEVRNVQVDQGLGPNKTLIKVLAPPGTTYRDIVANMDKINQFTDFSDDGGRSFLAIKPPLNVNSKRIGVRYKEDGGADADGVIYVRPGVEDLSLGGARYAQVRIAVDGTHYLKGMAMYKDDLPEGVDLVFNTNKSSTGNKKDAMKELKRDEDGNVDRENPFGAVVRRQLLDKTGEKPTSAMNILNEEGDWDGWSRNLSSQTLSKQSPKLAKQQLDMTFEKRKTEFDEISQLTNPTVRQKLLRAFADGTDSAAAHLKAAALPRSSWHVILPFNTLKESEIYAPNFRNGEKVALIRYPHGGTFEIPELVVNNNHPAAKRALGRAKDAVGINSKVAQRLSGADFDGDAVLVIPNNNRKIKTTAPLEGLKDFDPQRSYPGYEGMKKMDARTKGVEMGRVSNLITDMTIQGASTSELARAIRHSMVVIDAEKHGLNWKESARANGISDLMKKYQGRSGGGAATLVSRAGSDLRVPERKRTPIIDKETGKKIWIETGGSYVDSKGKTKQKTTLTTKLAEAEDAYTLSSGTPIESVYAEHSNRLKAMANDARRDMVNTRSTPYSRSARIAYADEVKTLEAKLNLAIRNRPLERQARVIASTQVAAKRAANPDLTNDELKKISSLALIEARNRTGAGKELITLTDNEWAAIQAGAVTPSRLKDILDNADLDQIKKLATPRTEVAMSSTKTQRAESMLASGYTQAEVADALGVSLSTLKNTINK